MPRTCLSALLVVGGIVFVALASPPDARADAQSASPPDAMRYEGRAIERARRAPVHSEHRPWLVQVVRDVRRALAVLAGPSSDAARGAAWERLREAHDELENPPGAVDPRLQGPLVRLRAALSSLLAADERAEQHRLAAQTLGELTRARETRVRSKLGGEVPAQSAPGIQALPVGGPR